MGSGTQAGKQAALLALDWGTSSLRAYLLAGAAEVLEVRSADWGIMNLPEGRFTAALEMLCGDWLREHPGLPVIASGMVGSAQGWVEVPYATAPASPRELASGLRHAEGPCGRRIAIVPGVLQDGSKPNVMRGEETQVFGALQAAPDLFANGTGILVLPGTHSKWVRVENGKIVSFLTFMTGELFAVLRQHSILGRLMKDSSEFDLAAFERGLTEAESENGLTSSLFSVRSLGLTKQLAGTQLGDYLSGLLIGHEILEARRLYSAGLLHPVPLIGAASLCQRYALALARFGVAVHGGNFAGATPAGLWEIARHAGMIPNEET